MPSLFKSTDGGYWGYDTIGFFIPELTYSSVNDPTDPEGPIDEFKWMVDQLHQNGIEVFLDVVYNHTGEGGLWQDEIQYDDVPPLPDGDPQLTALRPEGGRERLRVARPRQPGLLRPLARTTRPTGTTPASGRTRAATTRRSPA